MKINRLETHDRLLYYKKEQESSIVQGLQDCIKSNPLSVALQDKSPYIYIFAHPRTADDGANKRMLWQPRLEKPSAQTNSYLFRLQSKTDNVEICWMLPPRELWGQYEKGKVTENELVLWSIAQFMYNKKQLEAPNSDDMTKEQIKNIYLDIAAAMDQDKMRGKLYTSKPNPSEASVTYSWE